MLGYITSGSKYGSISTDLLSKMTEKQKKKKKCSCDTENIPKSPVVNPWGSEDGEFFPGGVKWIH